MNIDDINKLTDSLFQDHQDGGKIFKEAQLFRQEIENETDRGLVLFGVSRLEVLLKELLKKNLLGSDKQKESLFDFNGPLGTFSAKINMGYSLGLIPLSMRTELDILRKLRNEFAHSDKAIHFETSSIANICNRLSYMVKVPNPADRIRTALEISLIYYHLRIGIKNAKPIPEKKDFFDATAKIKLEKVINNIKQDMENNFKTTKPQ